MILFHEVRRRVDIAENGAISPTATRTTQFQNCVWSHVECLQPFVLFIGLKMRVVVMFLCKNFLPIPLLYYRTLKTCVCVMSEKYMQLRFTA
jgi:hypothetical protein